MPASPSIRTAAFAAITCLAAWGSALQGVGVEADRRLGDADLAWERGDYPGALRTYLSLLDSTEADRLLPAIALRTGELFHTTELTTDGGAPQFSADGRYLAYEVGRAAGRRTRVAPAGIPTAAIAELAGHGASFAPDGRQVVYLRTPARTAPGGPPASSAEETADVVIRRLPDGGEHRIDTGSLRVTSVLAGAGDTILLSAPDANGIEQLHLAGPGRTPTTLTSDLPARALRAVNASGTHALVAHVLRRPGTPPTFGLVALADGSEKIVAGSAPAFSSDGHSLVWIRWTDGLAHVLAARVETPAEAAVVRSGAEPVDSPALSFDGRRVAFQIMHEHDWELHVVNRDGSGERRVTEEMQHDVMPRFLDPDRLFALMGEPRHRRSYLYDLRTGTRTRLFHNNAVRTIAPEYQWAASPDGTTLLVVADRDGDTVSPRRGVYLMDLGRTVTRDALRARLVASLAGEEALRARGRQLFDPIADAVGTVVGEASQSRMLTYQQALFSFGSKHISQPGNQQAAEYLFTAFASFGYEPEYQWFDTPGALGGRTANVLATLPGTEHPEVVYVVSSHYDSVARSPGADDNSSGTAALLETARLLAARPQPATIVFASFTGEESGLLGSREFVRRARAAGTRVVGVLNNDMVGWSGNGRLDNTVRYTSEGIRDIQHAAAIQFTDLITYESRYFRGTDAQAFYEGYGGILGGIGSYPILGNPHYHQSSDVIDTVDHQLVTEVAKTTVASIMRLASSPAPVVDLRVHEIERGRVRLSWSASPERDVTGFVVEWQGPTGGPPQQLRVTETTAVIAATSGSRVSVRSVNRRHAESWDTAQVTVP